MGKADANGDAALAEKLRGQPEQPRPGVGVDPTRPIGPGNPPERGGHRGPMQGPGPAKLRKARLIEQRNQRLARAQQVFELVIGGTTIRRAAEMLGMSKSEAGRLYQMGLERQSEGTSEDFRNRQMARLERMLHSLWPKVVKGDPIATREARHVTDQMNRLQGAYPALGVELSGSVTTQHEGMNRVAIALEALRAQRERQGGLAVEAEAVDDLPALPAAASA